MLRVSLLVTVLGVFGVVSSTTSASVPDTSRHMPRAIRADASGEVELDDFAWLAGSWEGPGPQGALAEIHFMPPKAGVLPSLFRLTQGGRVMVLEAITLREEADGLFMYVRHFDPALVPLEEERALKLRFVEREGDAFRFENVYADENPRRSVMTRTEEGFVSLSELARPGGGMDTIRVEYRRAEDGAPSR